MFGRSFSANGYRVSGVGFSDPEITAFINELEQFGKIEYLELDFN